MSMRRREVITLIGGAAATWPLKVRAQQPGRTYRLGLLSQAGRQTPQILAFFDELRLLGFVEGHNLAVIPEGFDAPIEQLASRAEAMLKAVPDVLVGAGEGATRALKSATQTVPIIGAAEDMLASGLVPSLSRPGGNVTGFSLLSPELDGKRQDILIEMVPRARRMAALADRTQTPPSHTKALQDAAGTRGVELFVFSIAGPDEIVPAIAAAKAAGAQAVNVLASPMLFGNARVTRYWGPALRLPAIFQWPEAAEQGAFAAYGPRLYRWYRERAQMVSKVLRGARPADIPVEQPTRFELVINLQTAKEIGHEVPAGLVLRADKVIE
jgi:putative ABC transport system substrate-binding protein